MSSLLQEFKKFCGNLSMEQVNAAFKAFDISGDNQLDYDEFCKLMNNRRAGTMIIYWINSPSQGTRRRKRRERRRGRRRRRRNGRSTSMRGGGGEAVLMKTMRKKRERSSIICEV